MPKVHTIRIVRSKGTRKMPKRILDRFDLEAEREGAAVVKHNLTICKPFGIGKKITKERNARADGEAFIQRRTIKQSFAQTRYA
jgi:hypothetical protein